jgi:hypothetical protein
MQFKEKAIKINNVFQNEDSVTPFECTIGNLNMFSGDINGTIVLCINQTNISGNNVVIYLGKGYWYQLRKCFESITYDLNHLNTIVDQVRHYRDVFYQAIYNEIKTASNACRGVANIHFCKDEEFLKVQVKEIAYKFYFPQQPSENSFDLEKLLLELKLKSLNSVVKQMSM